MDSLPAMRTGRFRREENHVARYAWPAGVGRRELPGTPPTACATAARAATAIGCAARSTCARPSFLRAAEALTGAPVSHGNDAELLINGDQIFPAYLERDPRRRGDA